MSKKIRGNITEFGKRIIKVLIDNGIVNSDGEPNYSEAERQCDLKGSYLSKAVRGNSMQKEKAEKFLRKFHVNPSWLNSGKGEPYLKNGTLDIKSEQANDIENHPLVKSYVEQINILKSQMEDKNELIRNLKKRLGE